MSVAFSLVFDSRFLGFWFSRFLVFFLGFHSVSPHYASTDHQVLCEADPFGRFRILLTSRFYLGFIEYSDFSDFSDFEVDCEQLHEVSPFFKVFWCCSSSDF